jgi:hypothetical protein
MTAIRNAALGAGLATGILGKLTYDSKVKGKTVGLPGSVAHISTNDKLTLTDKKDSIEETGKESVKSRLKTLGAVATVGVATSFVTGVSKKATKYFNNFQQSINNNLAKVSISGENLNEILSNSKLYNKFNSLQTPAKAGLLAAGVVLSIIAPLTELAIESKAGYIEGQHENN